MSYVNKGTRIFEKTPKPKTVNKVRSEFRMKRYNSADDLRTWCDNVEQRRQQILEYQNKVGRSTKRCPEKLIPLEALFDVVLAMKEEKINDLEQELTILDQAVNAAYKIKLSPEQQAEFEKLKEELDAQYSDLSNEDESE